MGVDKKHADEIGAAALIANKTVPSLAVRAEIIFEENTDVLKIEVPMSRTIVASADGKIVRRRLKLDGTPENIPMYPYEINTRLSELSLLDFSAQPLLDATIEDLDPNERVRLRSIIKMRKGDNSLLELSDEELDKSLRIVKEENGILYPTITGMLLIGKEDRLRELMPTAKSSFQVLEGTQVRVNEQFSKPLLATFEIFENYLKAWNPEREMEYGLFRISIPEFSEAIHISEARTKANVEKLIESGLVEASGNGKARTYILSAKVYRAQENSVGYVRQTGIDTLKYEELTLKLAKQQGYVTRDNVRELLNISKSQAYRVLKKLADKDKLVLIGTGRTARYEVVK